MKSLWCHDFIMNHISNYVIFEVFSYIIRLGCPRCRPHRCPMVLLLMAEAEFETFASSSSFVVSCYAVSFVACEVSLVAPVI